MFNYLESKVSFFFKKKYRILLLAGSEADPHLLILELNQRLQGGIQGFINFNHSFIKYSFWLRRLFITLSLRIPNELTKEILRNIIGSFFGFSFSNSKL